MDAESIRDLFEGVAPFTIRRMFGGQGLFRDGLMFALEADGELYIKTDTENAHVFEDAGSSRFAYAKSDGKVFKMSYWRLPDMALDDPAEAARWARYGIDAARRAASSKKKRKVARGKPADSGAAGMIETMPDALFEEFKAAVDAYELESSD